MLRPARGGEDSGDEDMAGRVDDADKRGLSIDVNAPHVISSRPPEPISPMSLERWKATVKNEVLPALNTDVTTRLETVTREAMHRGHIDHAESMAFAGAGTLTPLGSMITPVASMTTDYIGGVPNRPDLERDLSGTSAPSSVGRVATSGELNNYHLWMAVKEGDARKVSQCLKEQGHVDMVVGEKDDFECVHYKGRNFRANPLHRAALCGHASVIETLIAWKADISARATNAVEENKVRSCQAIHMVLGSGSSKALKALLDLRADPLAEAQINGHLHYFPIHDAAFFDAEWGVHLLCQHKAKIDAANNCGDTPLHLCAKYGHSNCAEQILKIRNRLGQSLHGGQDHQIVNLVCMRNDAGQTALEVAVTAGQFPPRKLWIFTNCFDGKVESHRQRLIEAFWNVAKACPAAVPLLLRQGEEGDSDLSGVPIPKKWVHAFKEGGKNGVIKVNDLAALVYEAPQAYCDLLEAISAEPLVDNKEHHPLPVRVALVNDSEACAMSCVYQNEDRWIWNAGSKVQRAWHRSFAGADPKHGVEVIIKVVHLRGMADLELVWYLGTAQNLRVFTKLSSHALLKYMWSQLAYVYIVDLVHEVATVIVLSIWACGESTTDPSKTMRCIMWSIVASFGIVEAIFLVWCLIKLPHFLNQRFQNLLDRSTGGDGPQFTYSEIQVKRKCCRSWGRFSQCIKRAWHTDCAFVKQWSHEFLLTALTISLAVAFEEDLAATDNRSIILSITNLCHWVLLLYRLRAFQWLGKRLLPVMKSVVPIIGMVIIMTFMLLGFLHAFWAMDRHSGDETLLYQVVILLFAGEPFLFVEHLEALETSSRTYIIILTILALFIFGCCIVNVFIAVLGDIYDQEQDRVVCTYLQERARICSLMLLRPNLHIMSASRTVGGRFRASWCVFFVTVFSIASAAFGLAVHAHVKMDFPAWLAAAVLAIGLVLIQGIFRAALTEHWSEGTLWYCHEAEADEAEFLNASERTSQLHDGRLARIRKELQTTGEKVTQNCTIINNKCKRIISMMTSDGHDASPGSRQPGYTSESGTAPRESGPPERSDTWGTLPHTAGTITPVGHCDAEAAMTARCPLSDPTPHEKLPMTPMTPPLPPAGIGDLVAADHGAHSQATGEFGSQSPHAVGITSAARTHRRHSSPEARSPDALQQKIYSFQDGSDQPGVSEAMAVASQLVLDLTSMRTSIDTIMKRLDIQDQNHSRLEKTCGQTMKNLEEILAKAARRQDKKRHGHTAGHGISITAVTGDETTHATPPTSPAPGNDAPVNTDDKPVLQGLRGYRDQQPETSHPTEITTVATPAVASLGPVKLSHGRGEKELQALVIPDADKEAAGQMLSEGALPSDLTQTSGGPHAVHAATQNSSKEHVKDESHPVVITTADIASSTPLLEVKTREENSATASGNRPPEGESTKEGTLLASGSRDSAAPEKAEEMHRQRDPDRMMIASDKAANAFSVGDLCESKDTQGRWWPVKITGTHPDGTYAVDVLDGFDGHWNVVLAQQLRPFIWAYAEGDKCEAMNKEGRWWPVTVIARDRDRCTYAVEVHDECRSQWPVVFPWNLRSAQVRTREEGSLSNRPRGASHA